MSKASEITLCHVNKISRSEQKLNLPLESYSPWSPCRINHGLKSRNEIRDHTFYSRSSEDLQRTLQPEMSSHTKIK